MIAKRFADWLEKISVAGFAVGLFQFNGIGITTGIAALVGTMIITIYIERKDRK